MAQPLPLDLCNKVWTDPDRFAQPQREKKLLYSRGVWAGQEALMETQLGTAPSPRLWALQRCRERGGGACSRTIFLGGQPRVCSPWPSSSLCSVKQADLCFSASHLALEALWGLFSHLCRYGSSTFVPPFKFT